MTFTCASNYFNKVFLFFPPALNIMVTMLFNEALQGVSHWLQNLSWLQNLAFSFALMAAKRERGLLKHVKNVPSEMDSL